MNFLSLRHGLRDMRASLRNLKLFFIVLALGVGVMTTVGSLVESVKAAINRDARALLGGDIEIRQFYRPLTLPTEAFLSFHTTRVTRSMDMRTMAEKGDKRTLVELKGVDIFYPLYGELKLSKELTEEQRKDVRKNAGNLFPADAMVDQSLLDLLELKLGDIFKIGNANFMVVGVIESEPDRGFSSFALGPRVLTYRRYIQRTGLLQPGTMINYRYRALLPKGETPENFRKKLEQTFPDATLNLRDWTQSAPGIMSLIERLSLFFALTGITALMVAGIGIANATSMYMWSKRDTIAALKCLGASQAHIYKMYLFQILVVAALAIATGCALGVIAQSQLMEMLSSLLTIKGEHGIYWHSIILSAALGFVTVLLFTFIPMLGSADIKPKALLRGHLEQLTVKRWKEPNIAIMITVLVLLLVVLTMVFTNTVNITLYFALGLLYSMALLYVLGILLQKQARKLAHSGKFRITLSMALANLARPGSVTNGMVIALGISISLMVALTLVGSNLRMQVERGLPERAPAFFLADIQPSEWEALNTQLLAIKGVQKVAHLPMVRGRIVKLNGKDPDEVKIAENARWGVRSERGLTTAATPPEGSVIIKGKWWDKNYSGPPLVSFDANLARGMGLAIGDTITISILDHKITATIANLRDIQWGTLEMNFAIVLSPGALEGFPATYIATVTASPETEKAVQQALAKDFPSVAIVRVREVLSRISGILKNVSLAVMVTALITVSCSILVMAGAIHTSMRKRVFDTVMLKVLGADKRRILNIYLAEFCIIALVVTLIAIGIGTIGAYSIMQLMILSKFVMIPSVVALTTGASLVFAIILGLAATRSSLKVRPLSLLRNE